MELTTLNTNLRRTVLRLLFIIDVEFLRVLVFLHQEAPLTHFVATVIENITTGSMISPQL